jgi:hypothetical protein
VASYGKVSARTLAETRPFPAGLLSLRQMQERGSKLVAASGTSHWPNSRETGTPEDPFVVFPSRTGMLGNASVAIDACETPASLACALDPPVPEESHRRTAQSTDANGRRRATVFNRSSVGEPEAGKLTASGGTK